MSVTSCRTAPPYNVPDRDSAALARAGQHFGSRNSFVLAFGQPACNTRQDYGLENLGPRLSVFIVQTMKRTNETAGHRGETAHSHLSETMLEHLRQNTVKSTIFDGFGQLPGHFFRLFGQQTAHGP